MSKFNPHDPVHWAAQRLDISVSQAKTLYAEGKISGARDLKIREFLDDQWIAPIERARPQFDTPLAPFVNDPRTLLIPRLREGLAEDATPNRRLVEFHFYGFREHGESAYPVDRHHRAWRGHRVSVSRAQLVFAGYVEFSQLWTPWRGPDGEYKTPEEYAFRHVRFVGSATITPGKTYFEKEAEEFWSNLRKPRAEFLERLCDVLELLS
jgi:hypothetical protein